MISLATLTLLMCYAVLVMDMFIPNLLVLLMSTLNGLFGCLRPLLQTSKDPLQNGYCRCQNQRISGRGSRIVRLRPMVTEDGGHDVYPGSGPLDGGNTLLPA